MPQLVELLVHTVADDTTLLHQLWRVVLYLLQNPFAQRLAEVQALPHSLQRVVLSIETGRLDGLDGLQGRLQLHHLTRRHTTDGHLRDDTLQVPYPVQLLVDRLAEVGLAIVVVHDVEAFVDGPFVLQREHQPAAQQTATHRAHRPVDHVEERLAILLHRLQQFQRADGEFVEAHIFLLLDTLQRGDVCYLRVLCQFQILQDGSRGYHAVLQMVDAKALHRLHTEVLQQFLHGTLLRKHPVVELEGEELRAEVLFEVTLAGTVQEHLLRLQVAQHFFNVVVGALTRQELARRDVEERHATGHLAEVHSAEKVILLVVQHVVRQRHARRHQLGDAALHEFLRQLGVLQLVADGHALAGTYQLRQIRVQCVVGESRHLVALVITVVTVGQRDAQDTRRRDGVLAVRLVEVAAAEQHHRVGVLRLQVEKLLHHRGQLPVFLCHFTVLN